MSESDFNLDTVLGSHREFTSRQVSDTVGIPIHHARRYWRALGFANVSEGDEEFTSADIHALSTLLGLVSDGVLDDAQSLALSRALGRATARLSATHADGMAKFLNATGASGAERCSAATQMASRVLPEMDKLLLYSWRRHLAISLKRLQPHISLDGPTVVTVGFVDLVNFTSLSRQLSDGDLESLVERFENRVADLVTSHGGRVIKSLGDEVFFVADDPVVCAAIATDLTDIIRRRPYLPGVRIGLELGTVINHAGDVFGDTVNLASRLTSMAEPNQIMVGPVLADALGPNSSYQLSHNPPAKIRGYGVVTPSMLFRSAASRGA